MNLYTLIQHTHSIFRWFVLLILILAVVKAFIRWRSGIEWTEADRRRNLLAMTFVHIQVLIGAILYMISPAVNFGEGMMSNSITRFYTIEHTIMMLLATVIITIGYSRSKHKTGNAAKFRISFWYYLVALILILAAIPWPMRNLGGAWY